MHFKELFAKQKTLWFVIFVVLAIKTGLFLWFSHTFNFNAHPENTWINIWDRWDGAAYKTIAQSAYTFGEMKVDYWAFLSHFPPLYPAFMTIYSRVLDISIVSAGIVVSLLAILGASVTLWKLAYLEFKSEKIAWFSVIFLNLFPTSYFTIAIYSESLFLLFTILSFYLLKKDRYFLSGLAACGAILSRLVGVVFIPIFILHLISKRASLRKKIALLYPLLFSILGVIMYLVINKLYFHSFFFFLTEKLSFNTTKHVIFPFQETITDFIAIFTHSNFRDQTFMMSRGWNAIFTLFVTVVSILGIKKITWIYSLYSFLSILLFASLSWGISNARYALSVFPVFMQLAQIKNTKIVIFSMFISTLLLLYFTTIYTSGSWAF